MIKHWSFVGDLLLAFAFFLVGYNFGVYSEKQEHTEKEHEKAAYHIHNYCWSSRAVSINRPYNDIAGHKFPDHYCARNWVQRFQDA